MPFVIAGSVKMADDFQLLTVADYAQRAARTDKLKARQGLTFPLLGLFGETGSLLSEAKKKLRDKSSYLGYAEAVAEELGDVLWYLAAVCRRAGFALYEVAAEASGKARDPGLTFHALQPEHFPLFKDPTSATEQSLLTLAGEVGLLVHHHVGQGHVGIDKLRAQLVRVAHGLIVAATEAGVTLEGAAYKNLVKISDRWPEKREYPQAFDEIDDPEERLPRAMAIDIYERTVRGREYVFQKSSGVYVGDRLTDNAVVEDDYRFHDVFHYAYAAVLGWSPVMRALLRLKRKSRPEVDEAQDGARAILIEEGVTSWIFGQAQKLEFFGGIKRGGLPLDMLKHVRQFVAGYESAQCPLWMWEDAILQGYDAFRFLQDRRRAQVQIDFKRRRLHVKELP